jgi:hypothetical protein
VLLIVLAVAGIVAATVRVCADGGGMAAPYRTCTCRGIEWQLYDRTPVDGPRRTLRLGWVETRTCYLFQGAPEVACGE